MDAAEIVRTARRRAGLSQREMAAAAGIGRSTLSQVEAGGRIPSVRILNAVLAVAGLELAVDRPAPRAGEELRRHLRSSLTVRLYRWLNGRGDVRRERTLPAWCQLRSLVHTGRTELSGLAALGLWLPSGTTPTPLQVGFRLDPGCAPPQFDALELVELPEPSGTVPVALGLGVVWIPTPAELAFDPRCADHRSALRNVATLLDREAPEDARGRRPAAHREPDHRREEHEVWHTKRWKRLPMPPAYDHRSWRLDDQASLAAWLRVHGFPD